MLEIGNNKRLIIMKQWNFYRTIIGILVIISAFIVLVLTTGESVLGILLLVAGFSVLYTKKIGTGGLSCAWLTGCDPESDERSRKIGAYGLSYAWLTTFFVMFGLFLLDNLNVLRLGTQMALAFSIIVLVISARVYQFYLFRRGDID
jgi:hypothetical protein